MLVFKVFVDIQGEDRHLLKIIKVGSVKKKDEQNQKRTKSRKKILTTTSYSKVKRLSLMLG